MPRPAKRRIPPQAAAALNAKAEARASEVRARLAAEAARGPEALFGLHGEKAARREAWRLFEAQGERGFETLTSGSLDDFRHALAVAHVAVAAGVGALVAREDKADKLPEYRPGGAAAVETAVREAQTRRPVRVGVGRARRDGKRATSYVNQDGEPAGRAVKVQPAVLPWRVRRLALRALAFGALPWVQAQIAARRLPHGVHRSRAAAPPPAETLPSVEESLILGDLSVAVAELLALLKGRANATELQIVRHLTSGLSYSEVGQRLGVTKGTVAKHMGRLRERRLPNRARELLKALI